MTRTRFVVARPSSSVVDSNRLGQKDGPGVPSDWLNAIPVQAALQALPPEHAHCAAVVPINEKEEDGVDDGVGEGEERGQEVGRVGHRVLLVVHGPQVEDDVGTPAEEEQTCERAGNRVKLAQTVLLQTDKH